MSKEKLKIIQSSADEFRKLPQDKKMFILGFMQGVLSNQQENPPKQSVGIIQ